MMSEAIQTEDRVNQVFKEQIKLYEVAIELCHRHGKPKSKILKTLADILRDRLIQCQKDYIEWNEKLENKTKTEK